MRTTGMQRHVGSDRSGKTGGSAWANTKSRVRRRRRRIITSLIAVALVAGLAMVVRLVLEPGLVGPPRCTFTNASGAAFDLAPEQARHAATISAAATSRDLPPHAATIAVATAIQESRLRNLTGGDRDSLGLFQQRPSQGWGTPEQIRDPVYSTGKFYDGLVKVPGWQRLPLTQAAQKVQRSGYPDAYAQHETEAESYAAPLTGVRGEAVACRLKDADPVVSPSQLRTIVQRETGLKADTADNHLVLQTKGKRGATTVASWAVASADAFGITEVRIGSKTWRRSATSDALTWTDSGEKSSETTVRISLAHR